MLKSILTTYNTQNQKLGCRHHSAESIQKPEYLIKSIEDLANIISRRTENGKRFGKLEIIAPSETDFTSSLYKTSHQHENVQETMHLFASVLLDNSSSMCSGEKIVHAINTIINLLEVLLAEKKGKTTQTRKIHTWFCLMTFNDRAKVVVPFQELNDETFKTISDIVKQITASGSTSYEAAFRCQSEYLTKIMQSDESFVITTTDAEHAESATAAATSPTEHRPKQVHIVKIFETDGDITSGTTCFDTLYDAMHEQPKTHESYKNTIFSYEDIVIGYGVDVKTKCLKMLASPNPPQIKPQYHNDSNMPYNCSSFISIAKPDDIGWQIGEMLFKLLTRYGAQLKIELDVKKEEDSSLEGVTAVEVFEYQTHTWSKATTLHSIALNETKTVFVQLENSVSEFTNTIELTDQIKGHTFNYKFNHSVPQQVVIESPPSSEEPDDEEAIADADMLSMILAMLQLEIFKLMREIEADVTVYDNDLLVSETYKMIRILKDIKEGYIFRLEESKEDEEYQPYAMTPQLIWMENLIADAKVLIGLTTITAKNEQLAIIHARRTSSAERDFFRTGQSAMNTYIEGEEYQEIEAREAIEAEKKKKQEQHTDGADEHCQDDEENEMEFEVDIDTDYIPTRIATCMPPHQQKQWEQTKYGRNIKPNNLRSLCARISLAKENKEDYDIAKILRQIKNGRDEIDYHRQRVRSGQQQDDNETFSSIPDDEYSSRRVQMMRQMSSPSSQTSN